MPVVSIIELKNALRSNYRIIQTQRLNGHSIILQTSMKKYLSIKFQRCSLFLSLSFLEIFNANTSVMFQSMGQGSITDTFMFDFDKSAFCTC